MDDLILCSALWQAKRFVDCQYRLSVIDNIARDTVLTSGTSKVMLLSFDQNRASIIFVLYFPSILNVTSSLSQGMQSKVGHHQREGHGPHYYREQLKHEHAPFAPHSNR